VTLNKVIAGALYIVTCSYFVDHSSATSYAEL